MTDIGEEGTLREDVIEKSSASVRGLLWVVVLVAKVILVGSPLAFLPVISGVVRSPRAVQPGQSISFLEQPVSTVVGVSVMQVTYSSSSYSSESDEQVANAMVVGRNGPSALPTRFSQVQSEPDS